MATGYKGYGTPESVARQREIAQALMVNMRTPRNVGEGLSALGKALMIRGTRKRADEAEEKGRERASANSEAIMSALFGGAQGGYKPAAGAAPKGREAVTKALAAPRGAAQEWSPEVAERAINAPPVDMAALEGVDPRTVDAFGNLQSSYGQPLPVTSGLRSPEHNARVGGAEKSRHMAEHGGDAIDIDTSGMSEEDKLRLIQDASAQGFTGIGVYDNSIHLDRGDRRAWGPSYGRESVPQWAQPVIQTHLAGGQQMAQGPVATMTGAAPQQPPMGGPQGGMDPAQMQELLRIYNDPWTSEGDRMLIGNYLEQQMAQRQPMSPSDRYKVVGGRLVDLAAEGGPQVTIDAPEKDYALDRKVDALMQTGLDRNTALNIATGRYTISRDPVTQSAQVVDVATGRIIGAAPQGAAGGAPGRLPRPTDALPPEAGGPGAASGAGFGVPDETLYERADEATGVMPTLREWSTDIPGQLPGELGEAFQFPETVEDRQAFRTAAGKMFRAMSVNPKMPVAEINRIREQFKIEPGMWTSSTGLRARMRSIADSLETTIQEQRALAGDPSMPAEARKSAAENAAAIQDFLREMGVPAEGAASTNGGQSGGGGWHQTPGGVRYRIED